MCYSQFYHFRIKDKKVSNRPKIRVDRSGDIYVNIEEQSERSANADRNQIWSLMEVHVGSHLPKRIQWNSVRTD